MKRAAYSEIIPVVYPVGLTEVDENRECGKEEQMWIRGVYWFLPKELRLIILRDMALDLITTNYKNNLFFNLPPEVINQMQNIVGYYDADGYHETSVFDVLKEKCLHKYFGNPQDMRFYKHLLWVLRDRAHGARWIRIRRKLEYNQ